jgi:threonine synthase
VCAGHGTKRVGCQSRPPVYAEPKVSRRARVASHSESGRANGAVRAVPAAASQIDCQPPVASASHRSQPAILPTSNSPARAIRGPAPSIGVSVSSKAQACRKKAGLVMPGTARILEMDDPPEVSGIHIEDGYIGECYGVPSEAGNAAVLEVAQSEAIFLDPVYTGKAMSGLIDMARRKLIDTDRTVVFIHTGGGPGLFHCRPDQPRTY